MFGEIEELLRRIQKSCRLQLDEIPVTLKTEKQVFLRSLKCSMVFDLA